ncbi:hypothetical protein DFJ73DRAFT_912467 [Zopfochytrium polystomum]|nr:hypothetical protein DFJ73DRAFT_912467 [Zopfochytrium polystomum]
MTAESKGAPTRLSDTTKAEKTVVGAAMVGVAALGDRVENGMQNGILSDVDTTPPKLRDEQKIELHMAQHLRPTPQALHELEAINKLHLSVKMPLKLPLTAYEDNSPRIHMTVNNLHMDRSKHIRLRYHHIQSLVEEGLV